MKKFSVKNLKIIAKTKNLIFSPIIKLKFPLIITPILNPNFQDTVSLVYILPVHFYTFT